MVSSSVSAHTALADPSLAETDHASPSTHHDVARDPIRAGAVSDGGRWPFSVSLCLHKRTIAGNRVVTALEALKSAAQLCTRQGSARADPSRPVLDSSTTGTLQHEHASGDSIAETGSPSLLENALCDTATFSSTLTVRSGGLLRYPVAIFTV